MAGELALGKGSLKNSGRQFSAPISEAQLAAQRR
jgi:hypothetical protein